MSDQNITEAIEGLPQSQPIDINTSNTKEQTVTQTRSKQSDQLIGPHNNDTAKLVYTHSDLDPLVLPACHVCTKDLKSLNCSFDVQGKVFVCFKCLATGEESSRHKRSHSYKISEPLNISLFDSDWSLKDELKLLEGMQNYGFGNWIAISKMIAKPVFECQRHYMKVDQPNIVLVEESRLPRLACSNTR